MDVVRKMEVSIELSGIISWSFLMIYHTYLFLNYAFLPLLKELEYIRNS